MIVQMTYDRTKTKITIDAVPKKLCSKIGDGKILVSDLDNVYRIRTGEHGIDAVAEFL